jgi:AcrR family transcriptional regulator
MPIEQLGSTVRDDDRAATESAASHVNGSRVAIVRAFTALLFESGYAAVTVGDIVRRSLVARSTFYEHFSSKAGVLVASMEPFLAVFAHSAANDAPSGKLAAILTHMFENKRLTDQLFTGTARKELRRSLAQMLSEHLGALSIETGFKIRLPLPLASVQIAEAQLSLVEAWLRGRAHCDAMQLAEGMHAATRAHALALLKR